MEKNAQKQHFTKSIINIRTMQNYYSRAIPVAKAAGIYFRIDLTFFCKIVIILNVRIITILFCIKRKQGRNVKHGHIIALSDNG